MSQSFADLGLPPKVVAALFIDDIIEPTPVQAAVLPDALAGHDVLGRAQTGSGKTLAFGLPVIARLAGEPSRINRPRAIIIVPTRELAGQVEKSLSPIARAMKLRLATVYGGTPYDKQIRSLRNGVDIVIATPGRLGDLIERGALKTEDVAITVLDEADHLCDLGFFPVVDELLEKTPSDAQRLLLSATLDGDVDTLVNKHLRDPKLHELDPNAGAVTTMEHHVMVVSGYSDKLATTAKLVAANPRCIVFTRTREGAMELRDTLADHGVVAVDLHGNLTQRVRERNLAKFKSGDAQAIVATDVAARGIHVDGIGLVIHFDAPNDAKAYLHRSGRTARAGEDGTVLTLTVRKQLGTVQRLQKAAGVEAKLHDSRGMLEPMTVKSLSEAEAVVVAPDTRPRNDRPRSDRPRSDRPRQGGSRYDRPRSDRPARSGDRFERTDRPARSGDRFERTDRPARSGDRFERTDRPARSGDRFERTDRPARSGDRFERTDRPARSGDRFERTDRPARRANRTDQPRTAAHKTGKKARWTGAEKRAAK